MNEQSPSPTPEQAADDVIASARLSGQDVSDLRPLLLRIARGEEIAEEWIRVEVKRLSRRPVCPEHPLDTTDSCDPNGESTGDRFCGRCDWLWLGGSGITDEN